MKKEKIGVTTATKNNKKSAFLRIPCAEAGGVGPHSIVHRTDHLSDAGQNRLASTSMPPQLNYNMNFKKQKNSTSISEDVVQSHS
jgi:hypothetical protein